MFIAFTPFGTELNHICPIKKDTWKGDWIVADRQDMKDIEHKVDKMDMVIMFIHGGGFVYGFSTIYMESYLLILNELKKQNIRAAILSVDYSRSPECHYPVALNECVDAYRYLVHELSVSPARIVMMGDSAGGNLVSTTLLSLKNQRSLDRLQDMPPLPLPAAAVLVSPWVDLTPYLSTFNNHVDTDSVHPRQLALFTSYYLPGWNTRSPEERSEQLKDPYVSPLHGDFSGMCPLLITYGEVEIMRGQIEVFIRKVKTQCEVTVLQGQQCPHDWLIHPTMSPSVTAYETDCRRVAEWLSQMCPSQEVGHMAL